MASRLENAVSPYLRSHADNPVDWWPWGAEAFAEAVRRDVPVLVSIGYATCHWCHVMARETFADEAVGQWLAARVVAIKVDREEHPEVDAAYMAAAGAFTEQLGWPLTVFVTPDGRAFFAATYLPPRAQGGIPSFRDVVDAVVTAWNEQRDEVLQSASGLQDALRAAGERPSSSVPQAVPEITAALAQATAELAGHEDAEHGGFGGAPKFPVAPVLLMLHGRGLEGDTAAGALAARSLARLAASDLRDPVEGGFFRYATRRDWSEPHYERMLDDNALLLELAARVGDHATASGVADFLGGVMRVRGGFASGQDSESLIDGERNEGGYYALDAEGRTAQPAPPLDDKVLTAGNGLAIGALAVASRLLHEPAWAALAAEVADELLAAHVHVDRGTLALVRASRDGRASAASATLEDAGDLAVGLLELAIATGEERYAVTARAIVDACVDAGERAGLPAALPGGGDPVLAAQGLATADDANEGSAPSGSAAIARAALLLHRLTAVSRYRETAEALVGALMPQASERPIAFGATLQVASALAAPSRQLVVVAPDEAALDGDALAEHARRAQGDGMLALALTEARAEAWTRAGFSLLEGRTTVDGRTAAYPCTDFVCRLPVTSVAALLDAALADE